MPEVGVCRNDKVPGIVMKVFSDVSNWSFVVFRNLPLNHHPDKTLFYEVSESIWCTSSD